MTIYNTPKKEEDRKIVGKLSKIIYNYINKKTGFDVVAP